MLASQGTASVGMWEGGGGGGGAAQPRGGMRKPPVRQKRQWPPTKPKTGSLRFKYIVKERFRLSGRRGFRVQDLGAWLRVLGRRNERV